MTVPNTISINGTDYIRATEAGPASPTQIVVADRGWVFYGNTFTGESGDITITNAQVIRRWGTKNGLGELATKGKQTNTVLETSGTVRVPARSVVAVFDSVTL